MWHGSASRYLVKHVTDRFVDEHSIQVRSRNMPHQLVVFTDFVELFFGQTAQFRIGIEGLAEILVQDDGRKRAGRDISANLSGIDPSRADEQRINERLYLETPPKVHHPIYIGGDRASIVREVWPQRVNLLPELPLSGEARNQKRPGDPKIDHHIPPHSHHSHTDPALTPAQHR